MNSIPTNQKNTTNNTYHKYIPNVYLAKTVKEYKKGDVIDLVTRRGKTVKNIVHNFIGKNSTHYFYSITRQDGINLQTIAKRKLAQRLEWSKKAKEQAEQTNLENNLSSSDFQHFSFLSCGQPINDKNIRYQKRVEKLRNRVDNVFKKRNELEEKAEHHDDRAEYYESIKNNINLSMPESLHFYKEAKAQAEQYHKGLKDGTIAKEHDHSMEYAYKEKKELTKKYNYAVKLWG